MSGEPVGASTARAIADARKHLLSLADVTKATAAATQMVNDVNDALNEMHHLDAASSLLARTLAARGIAGMAAAWWNDLMPQLPVPVTAGALRSIADDMPPEITQTQIKVDGGEKR